MGIKIVYQTDISRLDSRSACIGTGVVDTS